MRLYLVRHGESTTNHTGKFAGQTDVPLTELGLRQAMCVANFFEDIPLDAVYSSDLTRAADTLRPTAQRHGKPLVLDKGLREVFAGKWEGRAFEELPVHYAEDFSVWQHDIGAARCTGGESMAEAAARADAALCRIAQEHPHGTVAAATHGGIIRGLLSLWTTGSTAAMQSVGWVPNASVLVADFENVGFRLVDGPITAHLGELVTELPKTV